MYTFLAFLLCNLLWHQSGLCSLEFQHFQNVVSFNDFNLPENLTIGSANVRSRLECFIMCQKTENCLTMFVKLGIRVECIFSDKSTEELSGQLTTGDHFRCFSQFIGNGNMPDNTTYDHDQSSTATPLDLVASSSDGSTIDWYQSSDTIQSSFDLPLSPSEQSISSQTLQPTIAITPTMDETTIVVTSQSWTTDSDLAMVTSSFAISSMTAVTSTTIYMSTVTPSIASAASRFSIRMSMTRIALLSAINLSPTKSQTITMSCSEDVSGEDSSCSSGDNNVSGEDGSSDGSGSGDEGETDSASPDNDKRK